MSLTKIGGAVGDIKKIGVVNSVADLAGLVGKEGGQQVSVKGYHTGSDVGGGIFYWDGSRTGENDGGTVFDGWVRILDGYATPEMFGARGDGLDESAVFQALFDATTSAKLSGNRVYLVRNLVLNKPYTLLGDSGSVLKKPDSTTGGIIKSTFANGLITIRDVTFDGNYQNQTPLQTARILDFNFEGLEGAGLAPDILIDNCSLRNIESNGIRYIADWSAATNITSNMVIRNSRFIGSQPGTPSFGTQFVSVGNGGAVTLDGNTFDSQIDDYSVVSPVAISLAKRAAASVEGTITVVNNRTYRCGRGGSGISNALGAIEVYSDGFGIIIANNLCYRSNTRAISVKTDSPYVNISNNVIVNEQPTSYGIDVIGAADGSTKQANTEGFVIANNVMRRCYHGVRIESRGSDGLVPNVTISSNQIIDCDARPIGQPTRCVYVQRGEHVTIVGNTIRNSALFSEADLNGINLSGCGEHIIIADNNISTANIGIVNSAGAACEVVITGNFLSQIALYGYSDTGVARLIVRGNTLVTSAGDVGIRTRNATKKSVIKQNLVEGFNTSISAIGTVTEYTIGDNELF